MVVAWKYNQKHEDKSLLMNSLTLQLRIWYVFSKNNYKITQTLE